CARRRRNRGKTGRVDAGAGAAQGGRGRRRRSRHLDRHSREAGWYAGDAVTHRPEDKPRKTNGKSGPTTPARDEDDEQAARDRDVAQAMARIEAQMPMIQSDEDSIISATPRDAMFEEADSVTGAFTAPALDEIGAPSLAARSIAPGEALQLVRYARRGNTLVISGLTPHGRRLTFEQREDRDGWYVVVAGRRRRPTERELGLVVASITQEVEAAMAPEESEVRSAYQLAAASDQPGMPIQGLQAYRDLLLDEAAAFTAGQIQRLAVVAIEYQAFKR